MFEISACPVAQDKQFFFQDKQLFDKFSYFYIRQFIRASKFFRQISNTVHIYFHSNPGPFEAVPSHTPYWCMYASLNYWLHLTDWNQILSTSNILSQPFEPYYYSCLTAISFYFILFYFAGKARKSVLCELCE